MVIRMLFLFWIKMAETSTSTLDFSGDKLFQSFMQDVSLCKIKNILILTFFQFNFTTFLYHWIVTLNALVNNCIDRLILIRQTKHITVIHSKANQIHVVSCFTQRKEWYIYSMYIHINGFDFRIKQPTKWCKKTFFDIF